MTHYHRHKTTSPSPPGTLNLSDGKRIAESVIISFLAVALSAGITVATNYLTKADMSQWWQAILVPACMAALKSLRLLITDSQP